MMSDDERKIDIALSLKNWKEFSLSYQKAINFCRERSIELRSAIKENDPLWGTEPLIPQADLYDFCIIMLNLARSYDGKLTSIARGEKHSIIFSIQFDTPSCIETFHGELLSWIERAKFVDPLIDIDETHTFSKSHKNPKKKIAPSFSWVFISQKGRY